jgi:hypothetical protein
MQPFTYSRTDGFEMRLGSGRANHKKIGERRDTAQVKDDDIFGLFVLGKFRATPC